MVNFISHKDEVLAELDNKIPEILEEWGNAAEGYAIDLCPVAPVNGGNLRESISHAMNVGKKEAYVGTNVEYAPYVELGTGKYYAGGGRQTPWKYQDDEGKWHTTTGQRAQPYLRPSVEGHEKTYLQLAELILEK